MKLKKLKEDIDKILQHDSRYRDEEDYNVVIPIQGLCFEKEDVTGISAGSDWQRGQVLLHTKKPLSTVSNKRHSKLEKLCLHKLSNYKKINDLYNNEAPFEVKFKTKTETFDNKVEALNWFYEMLDKELDNVIV